MSAPIIISLSLSLSVLSLIRLTIVRRIYCSVTRGCHKTDNKEQTGRQSTHKSRPSAVCTRSDRKLLTSQSDLEANLRLHVLYTNSDRCLPYNVTKVEIKSPDQRAVKWLVAASGGELLT